MQVLKPLPDYFHRIRKAFDLGSGILCRMPLYSELFVMAAEFQTAKDNAIAGALPPEYSHTNHALF